MPVELFKTVEAHLRQRIDQVSVRVKDTALQAAIVEHFGESLCRLQVLELAAAGLIDFELAGAELRLRPCQQVYKSVHAEPPAAPPAPKPTPASSEPPAGSPELQKIAGEEDQTLEADAHERAERIWAELPGKTRRAKLAAARDYIVSRITDPLALERFLVLGQANKSLSSCTEPQLLRLLGYVDTAVATATAT